MTKVTTVTIEPHPGQELGLLTPRAAIILFSWLLVLAHVKSRGNGPLSDCGGHGLWVASVGGIDRGRRCTKVVF
jgi:hypothetical protein